MSDTPLSFTGPAATGPGTQPLDEDGAQLEYMDMPKEMSVYEAPDLPEPEEARGMKAALTILQDVLTTLKAGGLNGKDRYFDLTGLSEDNLDFVNQVLGEGEVSVIAGPDMQAQETILAGVWRIRGKTDGGDVQDYIEVADFPSIAKEIAGQGAKSKVEIPRVFMEGVFNAPALLSEINEHIPVAEKPGGIHAINLSLLPHTENDLQFITQQVGEGNVIVLSRGYGNCRVSSTKTKNTWWVQYYNSQDTVILNSIEITKLPEVVCAAPEDMEESADRLTEILGVYV
ncbi:hydrogenase expression/formation protein [Kordiimonas lipolytica]|uniref:Hydrogenase expression/formation protein n=1 Tax=Kordiimonas lipolytica TaxID=1662421 RepID=A0ABV8UBM5_9PROT|nr:hydrogenase expression/formation protein [Kordiimonas lipolytica]